MIKKSISELTKKRKNLQEHPGIKRFKLERKKRDREFAKKQPIALENKKEYLEGCRWIKKVLKYKKENKLIY